MLQLKDAGKMHGEVDLKIYRNGKLEREDHDHNLIVLAGRTKLAQLLGGASNNHITKVGVGSGTADASDTDEGLTDTVYIPIDSTEYSEAKVRFNFTIGTDQANGLAIRELGLFFDDNTLFSRRVRQSVIGKENDIQITGYWEIYF